MGFKLPCIVSSLKSLDVDHHSIINAFSELIQDYVNSDELKTQVTRVMCIPQFFERKHV